jgi:hypothetical protein
MFEGVKGTYLFTNTVEPNPGTACKSEDVKNCMWFDATPDRQIAEDEVTFDRMEPEPATYSLYEKSLQCKDCGPMTLRSLDGDLETVAMDGITPENAKALVTNNGHWTPDQTAERICSFSLTIFRNDPTKLDKMKETIIEGFQLAKESFGGELPEAANKTFAAIIDRLEEWVANPEST